MKQYGQILFILILSIVLIGCDSKENNKLEGQAKSGNEEEKISLFLDWAPNTYHTGIYVAKEKNIIKILE